MIGDVCMHRSNDTKVICMLSCFGKKLADLQTGLAISIKLEWSWIKRSRWPFCLGRFTRNGLARIPRQRRLVVKRVEVRRSAICEDVNDSFGFSRKMRKLRGQRIHLVDFAG